MAYALVIDEYYEPEASTYIGPAEVLHAEFWGPPQFPGMEQLIKGTLDAGAAVQGIKQLRTKIWIDPADWYNSKIKIEASAHDSPIPFAIWAAIIAAITAISGVAVIAYYVSRIDWGKATWPVSLMAIAGIGIVVLVGMAMARR